MYESHLRHVNNHCWQCCNGLINSISAISKYGTFSPVSSLFISFLVLPRNFTVSGFKSLRWYPVLILNVILFCIHILLLEDNQSLFHVFWWFTQNNLEYLIQNIIRQVILIYHSTLELIFYVYCLCISSLYFSMCTIC